MRVLTSLAYGCFKLKWRKTTLIFFTEASAVWILLLFVLLPILVSVLVGEISIASYFKTPFINYLVGLAKLAGILYIINYVLWGHILVFSSKGLTLASFLALIPYRVIRVKPSDVCFDDSNSENKLLHLEHGEDFEDNAYMNFKYNGRELFVNTLAPRYLWGKVIKTHALYWARWKNHKG